MGEAVLQVPPNLFCFSSFHPVFNAHWKSVIRFFCPLLNRATVPGAWYIHNNDYCQNMYVSFIFAVLIFAPLLVSSQKPNLRHIGKKAHHLASITWVIIFAMRPSALFGRVKGRPAAISSHQQRLDCALFSVPVPYYVSGGFSCLVFICYFLLFWFLMQR